MKKLLSLALVFALGFSLLCFPASNAAAAGTEKLFLHVGSPIALSDGAILPIDKENPDLVPLIHKDRTLVPLRFISEFFGAKVDYRAETKSGLVEVDGKSLEFPVGESYFLLNGEKVTLDTEAMNIAGRIFLPLRALCEEALGLTIDYKDSVIAIGAGITLDQATLDAVKGQIGSYVKVTSLAALKEYVTVGQYGYVFGGDKFAPGATAVATADEAVPADAPTAAPTPPTTEQANAGGVAEDGRGSSEGDYSATNTQVEGVDEADIIKTDGTYIYLLGGSRLKIVEAGSKMALVNDLPFEENSYVQEMYVDKDRLVVVGTRHEEGSGGGYPIPYAEDGATVDRASIMPYYGKTFSFVSVYDTSDIQNLEILRSFEIEGYITATRKVGDDLYLLTNLSLWNLDGSDPRPLMGENGKRLPMPVDDIMICPGQVAEQYLTLSAMDIRDEDEAVASETIAGGGYTTYMSTQAMYIGMPEYTEKGGEILKIAKFAVDEGKIGYAGTGQVKGSLNNQFSMDEQDGFLRVATTVWDNESKNNLYVLDENMNVCGSVLGFAPTERIYSVRFMGDRGYVVTFRQTDPLFVFDLSDPTAPKITGELKVPGFSSYLHPVTENILLGVGNDVQDLYIKDGSGKEVVVGQRTGGLKLSLFDVSDMGKPKEIDSLILGDQGYSELLYNHKVAMFKNSESFVAFPADLYSNSKEESFNGALLVSYQSNKLVEKGRIEGAENAYYDATDGYYFGQRLVYIGDTLYYAQGSLLRSFDLDTLKETGSLKLSK